MANGKRIVATKLDEQAHRFHQAMMDELGISSSRALRLQNRIFQLFCEMMGALKDEVDE